MHTHAGPAFESRVCRDWLLRTAMIPPNFEREVLVTYR